MLPDKKSASNTYVGIGVLLHVAGFYLQSRGMPTLGSAVFLVGSVLFIWGCVNYCQGKGYPGALGTLGLLWLLGLLVVVLLPDRYKDGGA